MISRLLDKLFRRSRCEVSVIVTTHEAYLPMLPACLASVNRQSVACEKILVLDSCGLPLLPEMEGWTVVSVNAGDPNVGRNEGLRYVTAPWVTYLDGDNEMGADYLARMLVYARKATWAVGIIYPSIDRVDKWGTPRWSMVAPDWDSWGLREATHVDSCSFWRTRAVQEVGWREGNPRWDDYVLALRLSRRGWGGMAAADVNATLVEHGANRSLVAGAHAVGQALWENRSLAVVTLVSGRASFRRVVDWIRGESWPEETRLVWLDDTGCPEGRTERTQRVSRSELDAMAVCLTRAGIVAEVSVVAAPSVSRAERQDPVWGRHIRISRLYNTALRDVHEDVVIFLEDDVVPPAGRGAARRLCEALRPGASPPVACVGAAYPSRELVEHACASQDSGVWRDPPRLAKLPKDRMIMGMVAGGFTAWSNAALRQVLPMTYHRDLRLGWDGCASRRAHDLGYYVLLDGAVRCEHLVDRSPRAPHDGGDS